MVAARLLPADLIPPRCYLTRTRRYVCVRAWVLSRIARCRSISRYAPPRRPSPPPASPSPSPRVVLVGCWPDFHPTEKRWEAAIHAALSPPTMETLVPEHLFVNIEGKSGYLVYEEALFILLLSLPSDIYIKTRY